MEREQIVKALECCGSEVTTELNCSSCPMRGKTDCMTLLYECALDTIKKLTAENERLEELRVRDKRYMDIFMDATGAKKVIADTKADTVRKMQERLKESILDMREGYVEAVVIVNRIAEEMLEGEQ